MVAVPAFGWFLVSKHGPTGTSPARGHSEGEEVSRKGAKEERKDRSRAETGKMPVSSGGEDSGRVETGVLPVSGIPASAFLPANVDGIFLDFLVCSLAVASVVIP